MRENEIEKIRDSEVSENEMVEKTEIDRVREREGE